MGKVPPAPERFDGVHRIGVVGDTHIPDRARALHPDLIPGLRAASVDLLIHTGDICAPFVLQELSAVAPVVAVRGNRDWAFAGKLPWLRLLVIGEVRIAIQHGMGSFWQYWLDKVKFVSDGYRFERYKDLLQRTYPGADVYLFGHTHHGENRVEDGALFFNPGSAAVTPPFWPEPSFGVLHLDDTASVNAEIVRMRRLGLNNRYWVIAGG